MLPHRGAFTHCGNPPIFLLRCRQAPLDPREFSLFRTPSAVISCASRSLIYPSVCPLLSLDAASLLACANTINLHCPCVCWREARERRGDGAMRLHCASVGGDACPAKSTFFISRPAGFSEKAIPAFHFWEIKASFPLSLLHAFEFYLHNLDWRGDFLMVSA